MTHRLREGVRERRGTVRADYIVPAKLGALTLRDGLVSAKSAYFASCDEFKAAKYRNAFGTTAGRFNALRTYFRSET